MKKGKILKLVALAGALPFVYGCSGGGVSSLASFLFGGTGIIGSGIALITGTAADVALTGGTELATLHNPEPASMLLLGGGLAAAAVFTRRKK